MENKFLSKIIARDLEGLNLISACCHNAKIKIENIKYLKNAEKNFSIVFL